VNIEYNNCPQEWMKTPVVLATRGCRNKILGMSHLIPAFTRYIGIEYSGVQTPLSSLPGLRVYLADGDAPPVEVLPPPSAKKYWTRRGIAEWLVERLAEDVPALVGIDHGFSFPLRYFEVHRLLPDWPPFLDEFQRHCRLMEIISMSISCVTALPAMAPRAWGIRAGGD